jgi:RNA polymerase sigma factor (sigma-70 family)
MEAHRLAGAMVVPAAKGPQQEAGVAAEPALLVNQHVESVYRFVAMVARNDQDSADLAQEALARAIRSLHRYDSAKGPLDAWLWRIVVNVARDAGRASVRRRSLGERLSGHAAADVTTVEDEVLRHLDDVALLAEVRALPKRARTLVALRFGANLTYSEMAQQLGLTPQAALMATRRALAQLRRALMEGQP